MKLQELTEDYGILPNPIQLPTLTKYVGTIENVDVWEDITGKIGTILGVKEHEQTIAYIIFEHKTIQNAHPLRYFWVDESQRGKGIGSLLLIFVLHNLNKKLMLTKDEIVTDGARSVILKAVQSNKIKVFCDNKQLSYGELRKIFNILGETKTELILEA